MVKVYYVKDGSHPQNFVDLGRRVPLDELERRIQDRDLRYLSTMPPEFNPAQPSHEARYVVVELEMAVLVVSVAGGREQLAIVMAITAPKTEAVEIRRCRVILWPSPDRLHRSLLRRWNRDWPVRRCHLHPRSYGAA